MMGIMVAICKIIEKNRDIIMRVLNFYVQEINFYLALCLVRQRKVSVHNQNISIFSLENV